MPNLRGFTEQTNPEWVTLDFDDGTSSHPIHDPSGDYRKEVAAIVPKVLGGTPPDPMAGALASNDPAPPPAGAPPTATDAPAPSFWSRISGAMVPPAAQLAGASPVAAKDPAAEMAVDRSSAGVQARYDAAHPEGPGARARLAAYEDKRGPVARPGGGPGTAVSDTPAAPPYNDPYPAQLTYTGGGGPQVTRSESTTTSGLTDKDKKAVDDANARAMGQRAEADQADYVARANQFFSDWQRLGADAQKQLAEKNALDQQQRELDGLVAAQRQRNTETASRPIDPAEALDGEAGAYAFMAAFGDAISNFGAALAGRGPVADPADRINQIIGRSVQLQTAQKQADLEQGRISADQFEADREHVRFKIATVAKQLAETELQRAHTADEYKALGALKQRMEAEQADASAKNAMATARQQQTTRQTTVQPGAPAQGGVNLFLGEEPDWKSVASHSERQAGGDQVERAIKRYEKATGYLWDGTANGGAGAFKDANGNIVSAGKADVPGTTAVGSNFKILSGEMGREVQGARDDLAAGQAKIKDPVGAVSDKSILAENEAMAATTDEGMHRAMERAARSLREMRAKVDAAYSPGVVNASRYRRQQEGDYQRTRPGLPQTRPATPEDLRRPQGTPPQQQQAPAQPKGQLVGNGVMR